MQDRAQLCGRQLWLSLRHLRGFATSISAATLTTTTLALASTTLALAASAITLTSTLTLALALTGLPAGRHRASVRRRLAFGRPPRLL